MHPDCEPGSFDLNGSDAGALSRQIRQGTVGIPHRPSLYFTGYGDGQLIVILTGISISLTTDQYDALAILAFKRLTTATGRVGKQDLAATSDQHLRAKIHRLRKELNAGAGADVGHQLIKNSIAGGYYLALTAHDIDVHDSCDEIPDGVLSINWSEFREALRSARERGPSAAPRRE